MHKPFSSQPDPADVLRANVENFSMPDGIPILITICRASNLPVSHTMHREPRAYVEIGLQGRPYSSKTKIADPSVSPTWNDERHVIMVPHLETKISFSVQRFMHAPVPGREPLLGQFACPAHELLSLRGPHMVTLHHDTTWPRGGLELEAQRIAMEEAFELVLKRAQEQFVPSGYFTKLLRSNASGQDPMSALSDVLSALRKIKKAGNLATKIHPLLNVAWKVLCLASVIYELQLQHDHEVMDLLSVMSEVYPYVAAVAEAGVAHIKQFRDHISRLLHLSAEYVGVVAKCVALPAMKRLIKPSPGVDTYRRQFEQLRDLFQLGANVQAVISAGLTAQAVLDMESHMILSRLKPAYTRQSTSNGCQYGTRSSLINAIVEWALSRHHDKKFIWLYGPPGLGKSAVAATVADSICQRGRLGAAYFFDRTSKDRCDLSGCLESLTYQLSQFSAPFGRAVARTMQETPGIVHASLKTRFHELLMKPASVLGDVREPTTIVIDGLDECEDLHARRELLSILTDELPFMPSFIRVLITSRPEYDIRGRFISAPYVHTVEMDAKDPQNISDLRTFVRQRLQEARSDHLISGGWPSDDQVEALVERASGIFKWAVMAMEVVACTTDPRSTVEQLVLDTYTDTQALVDWHVFGSQDRF